MIDIDDVDLALHELQQMMNVALRAAESLLGVGDGGVFQMPFEDANLLDFSLFDLDKRVKGIRAMLQERDRPPVRKPVLSIVRTGGDECA